MRYCENETVEVYEEVGTDLATLLRDVAAEVERLEGKVFSLNLDLETEDLEYRATLYAHG